MLDSLSKELPHTVSKQRFLFPAADKVFGMAIPYDGNMLVVLVQSYVDLRLSSPVIPSTLFSLCAFSEENI